MSTINYSLEQELAGMRDGGRYDPGPRESERPSAAEYEGFAQEGRAFARAAWERRERQLDDGADDEPGEQP
jgi:hypothetical protein